MTGRLLLALLALPLVLSACAPRDLLRKRDRAAATVAQVEARLAALAAGSPERAATETALAEAREILRQAQEAVDKARGESWYSGLGLAASVLDGTSPLVSALLPGAGGILALVARLLTAARGLIPKGVQA